MNARNKKKNNKQRAGLLLAAALLGLPAGAAWSQERISEAEARKTLAVLMDGFRARGLKAAVEQVNSGAECRLKDIGCVIATDAALVLAARQPALVGRDMSETTDADGRKLAQGMVTGPLRAGKTSWEASFRMGRADGKSTVLRRYLCHRLEGNTALCVGYSS